MLDTEFVDREMDSHDGPFKPIPLQHDTFRKSGGDILNYRSACKSELAISIYRYQSRWRAGPVIRVPTGIVPVVSLYQLRHVAAHQVHHIHSYYKSFVTWSWGTCGMEHQVAKSQQILAM